MAPRSDSLREYREKRGFAQVAVPDSTVRSRRAPRHLRFVVQEHHARRLHWDFRLEIDGALRSWAIPKGPSMDPAVRRLAVLVEDHPLDYMDFEGVIPAGRYGAGVVMVWDRGTYEMEEGVDPSDAFRAGKMTFTLQGERLRGAFHLIRLAPRRGSKAQWLVTKRQDASAITGWVLGEQRSAATGRTIEEVRRDHRGIAEPGAAEPASASQVGDAGEQRRGSPKRATRPWRQVLRRLSLASPGRDPLPPAAPMLATLRSEPPEGPHWWFEIKWDGVRALSYVTRAGRARRVRVVSRRGHEIARQYPEIVEALQAFDAPSLVLDGEIVVLDDDGRARFDRLQQRINLTDEDDVRRATAAHPVVYYVFDILYVNGHSLLDRPFVKRREILRSLLPETPTLRPSEAIQGEGRVFFDASRDLGLEGIVGKRWDSLYTPGARSPAWVKVKVRHMQEAVVCGYTEGHGYRGKTIGALILGVYDDAGGLIYVGHTGSGFTDTALREMVALLTPLKRPTCPFPVVPETNGPATWVEPRVVVEVEFVGWTGEGLMRSPVYLGIRTDKDPRAVRHEGPAPTEGAPTAPRGEETSRHRVDRAGAPSTSSRSKTPMGRDDGGLPPLPFKPTHLDKVLWPATGMTKGDLLRYLHQAAPHILPHLRDRPLSLRRFPDGVTTAGFFQKDIPEPPPFTTTVRVWSQQGRRVIRLVLGNDEVTLLWLGQLADLELHPWMSRVTPEPHLRAGVAFAKQSDFQDSVLTYPDYVVFDIDPFLEEPGPAHPGQRVERDPAYTRRGFEAASQVALRLRDILAELGLGAFVKTSGKTGLHVFLPIARRYTYDQTRAFARTLAEHLEHSLPDLVTTEWAVDKRRGKVFVDFNQNIAGKTLAGAYSVRAVPEGTVSTPVTWEELAEGMDPLAFTPEAVVSRLATRGDPWRDLLTHRQSLEIWASQQRG